MASSGSTSASDGAARGQRAGLVEGDRAHAGGYLEVRAALDQHAVAPGTRDRTHERYGRRDDERARARDHEDDERALDPYQPPA